MICRLGYPNQSGCGFSESVRAGIIELSFRHLLREYVDDYNADRVHTKLQDSPMGRPTEHRPSRQAHVIGLPRVTRKLRFLPFIIATSGDKQHDLSDPHAVETTLGPPDEKENRQASPPPAPLPRSRLAQKRPMIITAAPSPIGTTANCGSSTWSAASTLRTVRHARNQPSEAWERKWASSLTRDHAVNVDRP